MFVGYTENTYNSKMGDKCKTKLGICQREDALIQEAHKKYFIPPATQRLQKQTVVRPHTISIGAEMKSRGGSTDC